MTCSAARLRRTSISTTYPARMMIFKTSRFERREAEGFQEAPAEGNVAYSDLIWVSENSPITMYREGIIRRCAAR